MKHLSFTAKAFIVGVLLVGGGLIAWAAQDLDWTNGWVYVLALLGAVAQREDDSWTIAFGPVTAAQIGEIATFLTCQLSYVLLSEI